MKVSKTEARYVDQVDECEECTMFRAPTPGSPPDQKSGGRGGCTKVAGEIAPDRWWPVFRSQGAHARAQGG
jgi:hypothetical protein